MTAEFIETTPFLKTGPPKVERWRMIKNSD